MMKLNKIYISAFGGLKDFTLELHDGLNVIYGNNEDGKSTVAAFIKAMFYGTGRNTKNLADSIRLKYTPWDNSAMGGRIFFEHDSKKYCLEREFRKSDSTDRVTLTNLDSGKEVDIGDNIGQQFFGMSAAAFERSLFIGNGDFIKDDAAAGEINGKLSNIALTGSEDISFKKVEKNILDTRNKIISKNGKSGSYNEDLQALESLGQRLEKSQNDARLKAQLNDKAQQKLAELEQTTKEYQKLKTIVSREQDIKNREKLADFLETKRSLDDLNRSLTLPDGTQINENFTSKIEFTLGKYNTAFERCNQINQDITRINDTISLQNTSPETTKQQIDELTKEAELVSQEKKTFEIKEEELASRLNALNQQAQEMQNKKAAFNPLLLIISIVLAACGGATAFFISPIIAAVVIGIAAVLLALSFIIRPVDKSKIAALQSALAHLNNQLAETKAAKNLMQERVNDITARINTLNSVLQTDSSIKQQRLDDLAQKKDALQAEQEKASVAKDEVISLLSAFGDIDSIESAQEKLTELKQKTEQQKEIKLRLKTASQYLGNIDYDEAQQKLDALSKETDENIDFDSVKAKFEATGDKISTLKDEITAIVTEIKTSFRHTENPEELKREIKTLQEKVNSKKAFCEAADIARSVLEESFYELRRGYGSELEKATHDIFARLTNGKYKSVSVTDTLDLSVEKADVFGTRELEYLSLGTTHQAYLSLRLAITTLISDGSTLPIFLDDSLSQYDDTRAERAIAFLKDFCADGQGVLFTCHNSICDIAQNQDIKIQKPYK